ncbi:Addiction module toxin, RelE/StbE family protein [Sphingobium yanoikuyae]|uniref:Addiction module toxin, RelE/StbE family protein n=1 Tax=Sphingobium yanoikuyae TaxID=13690 RepID=A0A084EFN1_SPHYA|nr:type II toxin-antitoxin system RelE/ParE family toxin [Sphingobium yanoikuyae]KEZ16773.1 Addiction module toxin, RelE/StbE family protein [Sphingobium yanoikuyae]
MLPLIWHVAALDDLERIVDFIEAQTPAAAERIGNAIRHVAERLPDHPYLYRSGRVPGTREALVTPNYVIVYRVTDIIEILAVRHTRQQYP